MPSAKIPRRSTDTDMTPFVDIAFLILSFFIMATKFKPEDPVPIVTPGSVVSQELPKDDAVMITIDSANRVYFSVLSETDDELYTEVINRVNASRKLGLSDQEVSNFQNTPMVGVPFSQLKSLLATDSKDQINISQPGIPVLDSTNNQLFHWVKAAKFAHLERHKSEEAATRKKLSYLIKGDGLSKYPTFTAVVQALKKNDIFKYKLVTQLDDVPTGTELYKEQKEAEAKQKK